MQPGALTTAFSNGRADLQISISRRHQDDRIANERVSAWFAHSFAWYWAARVKRGKIISRRGGRGLSRHKAARRPNDVLIVGFLARAFSLLLPRGSTVVCQD
jgi:hypothetical protein